MNELQKGKRVNNKARKWALGLFVLMAIYLVLRWDYHASNYIFDRYCESETGSFIHEKVELDQQYFIPIDQVENIKKVSSSLVFENQYVLNEKKFEIEYTVLLLKRSQVSALGPIYSMESSIFRKADGKLLSKAVSANNQMGWFAQWVGQHFPGFGKVCPSEKGPRVGSPSGFHHSNLIKDTFIKAHSER